jgi:ribosomal-protein-alanine N-acetyltransferase
MDNIEIYSERFTLRSLRLDENLDSYLGWMKDVKNNKYILSARSNYTIEELISFIEENNRCSDQILLGIFTRDIKHIGNIRYSNIDLGNKSAEVGFLIGDLEFRGLGVAKEVFLYSIKWIKVTLQVETVYLGVDSQNTPAIHSYKKMGFAQSDSSGQKSKSLRMKFEL